jgi:hypothetical protein
MKKLKHIWWYLTDGNYRFIINNEFVLRLGYNHTYNHTDNRKHYKCVNSNTNLFIRTYENIYFDSGSKIWRLLGLLGSNKNSGKICTYIETNIHIIDISLSVSKLSHKKTELLLEKFSSNFKTNEELIISNRINKLSKIC